MGKTPCAGEFGSGGRAWNYTADISASHACFGRLDVKKQMVLENVAAGEERLDRHSNRQVDICPLDEIPEFFER